MFIYCKRSVLTDLARKTIEDALKITKQDVIDALGEVPQLRYIVHCNC